MCEARRQRGLVIAATSKITRDGKMWRVPSQSQPHSYLVKISASVSFCSCPDFEMRCEACKHIYAVEYVMQREQDGQGNELTVESVSVTKTPRPTYPQQWEAYNKAQINEKDLFQSLLRNLCDLIHEPRSTPAVGRPRIPQSDQIFMSTFKVYSTVSQRRFMCDLDDAREKGYLERTPHYNAIGKSLENRDMTLLLHKLIAASSLPLTSVEADFAIDSTGFSSSRNVRWYDAKYGKIRETHTWLKLHAICGVKTNVVTSCKVTESNANDSPHLPSLLQNTLENFNVNELSADAAYGSGENFQMIDGLGIDPYIPFKSNSTGGKGGAFSKAYHFFQLYRSDFLECYHKRSNIESTFSMIKRKFGDSIRSKTDIAMRNELLCKVLAHNICCLISAMYELGIEPKLLAV